MAYHTLEQYRLAADQGDVDAQFIVAVMYYLGNSTFNISKDYAQAETWFRKAADLGFRPAQDYLNRIQTSDVP